jgi:hypothetical protein
MILLAFKLSHILQKVNTPPLQSCNLLKHVFFYSLEKGERKRWREKKRDRDRKTERQRDRKTERQKDRKTGRQEDRKTEK